MEAVWYRKRDAYVLGGELFGDKIRLFQICGRSDALVRLAAFCFQDSYLGTYQNVGVPFARM